LATKDINFSSADYHAGIAAMKSNVRLSVMVFVSNISGCVCEVKRRRKKTTSSVGVTNGAIAAILEAQTQREREQRQQQRY